MPTSADWEAVKFVLLVVALFVIWFAVPSILCGNCGVLGRVNETNGFWFQAES